MPLAVADWLEQTAGVLIGPSGPFAVTQNGDALVAEDFYEDQYVCVMRRGHSAESAVWNTKTYANQHHVLVTPRGRSTRSDVDEALEVQGLARRITRVVPNFNLALSLVRRSNLITTMPERYAQSFPSEGVTTKPIPLTLPVVSMKFVVHPVHANDARTAFIKTLLKAALADASAVNLEKPAN